MKYGHVISAVANSPWALQLEKLQTIVEILQLRSQGVTFSAEEIAARIGAPVQRSQPKGNSIAVIPVYGVMAQRMNMMMEMSGGTSTQMLASAFREVIADETVKAVVFDFDSPGGSVFGISELAEEVYAARGRKPMVAVVNSLAASAAYWLAAQADEIVITPGGMAGSIGVFAVHTDWSAANEIEGIKPTYVSAGKYKVEGNPDEPLTDEARGFIQAQIDEYYDMFVSAVARGRRVPAATVLANYGEGRVLTASAAKRAGMVDRIATFDQVVAELGARPVQEAMQTQTAQSPSEGQPPTAETPSEEQPKLSRLWEIALSR